ncbi:MAG: flagellar hook-length control protein FliK [Patiriisocius sp.]|jgi:flagellar hook-length control protein FliK
MADLNSLLMQSPPATGSAEKSGAAIPAEKGALNSDGNPSASNGLFAAIFKTSVEQSLAVKSGNSLPKSGELEQPDTVSSGAELKSRQLKSGLQIIVGGAEPSTEGVDAFARTQGIDSRALAHLLGDSVPAAKSATVELPRQALENSEAIATWLSDPIVTDIVAKHAAKIGEESAKVSPPVAPFQEMPSKFLAQGSAPSLQLTPAIKTGTEDFTVSAQQIAEALKQQARAGGTPTLNTEEADALIAPTQQQAQSKTVPLTPVPQATTDDFKVSAQQIAEAIKQQAKLGRTPAINAEIADTVIIKSVIAKTLADNVNYLNSSQQKQPSIKLETIDLTRSALNTGLEKKSQESVLLASGTAASAAPLSVAPAPTSVAFSEAAYTASQQNALSSADKNLADSLPEQLQQQGLRKQEEHTEMSRRLAEALGQRLTAQIARGAWRVEMDLHPKSLGRIEIQLEMKNGELEANFFATNAATRELLNESMPRLRVALEEHGMETAYIGLGAGNKGNSDGKSTGQNEPESSAERGAVTDIEPEEIIRQLSNDGLDVLV